MDGLFPSAMLSAFLVKGRPVTLIARPYSWEDWAESSGYPPAPEDANLTFRFCRSIAGRAALDVRQRAGPVIRVVVDLSVGQQYFIRDVERTVVRLDAAMDWSWDREYSALDQADTPVRSIKGIKSHLARSTAVPTGIHQLWVNLQYQIPTAEVSPAGAIVVDHLVEGEPPMDRFSWPAEYTVQSVQGSNTGFGV